MDSRDLSMEYVGSSGVILSPEQKASLQTSLCILKHKQKFSRVYFWGKIIGLTDNYFIAQGVGPDEVSEKKILYSQDCVHWKLLPPVTEQIKQKAKLVRKRFTGDPSHIYEHFKIKTADDGCDAEEEEEPIIIKEEERLVAAIAEIENDARIVPRGSQVQSLTGHIYKNRNFEGLTVIEAGKLCNYSHFRKPIKLQEKCLLQRANLDKSVDFLDAIDEDVPTELWSLKFERNSGVVTLHSLLWLGYVFYHIPGTRNYGSLYVGMGEKNFDLPFMI